MLREDSIHPLDPQAFDAALIQYEQAAGTAAREHHEAQFRVLERATVLLAQANSSPDATKRSSIMDERGRLNRRAWGKAKKMAQINRVHIDLLASILPTEERLLLIERFGVPAYPEVWPNPHQVGAILEQARTLALEPNAALIAQLQSDHVSNQLVLCRAMMDEVDDWMDVVAERNTQPFAPFEEFKHRMIELNQARAKDAASMIEAAKTLVPHEAVAQLDQPIRSYRDSLLERRPREISVSFRP